MVFAPKTFIWCNINFTIIAGITIWSHVRNNYGNVRITISPLRALSRDESGLYVSNRHLGRNSPIGEYLDDSKNRPTVISRLLHHALRAAGAACGVEIKNGGRLSGTPKPTEILLTFSFIDLSSSPKYVDLCYSCASRNRLASFLLVFESSSKSTSYSFFFSLRKTINFFCSLSGKAAIKSSMTCS